jgi:hypothetical protein
MQLTASKERLSFMELSNSPVSPDLSFQCVLVALPSTSSQQLSNTISSSPLPERIKEMCPRWILFYEPQHRRRYTGHHYHEYLHLGFYNTCPFYERQQFRTDIVRVPTWKKNRYTCWRSVMDNKTILWTS